VGSLDLITRAIGFIGRRLLRNGDLTLVRSVGNIQNAVVDCATSFL
jgi:hypothetical protein